jgi:hypothetical protein
MEVEDQNLEDLALRARIPLGDLDTLMRGRGSFLTRGPSLTCATQSEFGRLKSPLPPLKDIPRSDAGVPEAYPPPGTETVFLSEQFATSSHRLATDLEESFLGFPDLVDYVL